MLENLGTAIAIYGPDKRLKFFNTAFARCGGSRRGCAAEPTLGEVLEIAARAAPAARILRFPRLQARHERHMISPIMSRSEELMHLPDGRTLRLLVSPHPLGGLIFIYEDVTDRLALERSYNTLIEVQRETLDNLFEGDRGVRQRRPAQAAQPGLSHDVGPVGRRRSPASRMSPRSSSGRAAFSTTAATGRRCSERLIARLDRARRIGSGRLERARRLGAAISPRCRCPTATSLLTYLDVSDTDARRARAARAQRSAGDRRPAQERVHRQRVLRAAHAAQRHHRLRRDPGEPVFRHAQRRGSSNTAAASSTASQRLLALINDILDLASIEAGYMKLELATVDVGGLLQACWR